MPSSIENLNTAIREWLSLATGINKNKIVLANQNKKLPSPPFIFLNLQSNMERISFAEDLKFDVTNKKKYISLYKTTVSIEFIGMPILSTLEQVLNKLEKYHYLFQDYGIGIIRDSVQITNVPSYFEQENEVTKSIIDLDCYITVEFEETVNVTQKVKFQADISGYSQSFPTFPTVEINTSIKQKMTTINSLPSDVTINISNITSSSVTISLSSNNNLSYIEVDVYDINDNFIIRRKILNNNESFTLDNLLPDTQYTIRSRTNLGGLFSEYTINSFITASATNLFAFYLKTLDFGNFWNGTLYAKNLITNQEYVIDTNVINFNRWTIPKTSKNGKYIAYHKLITGNWNFIVKDLETNTIIYQVLAVSGLDNTWVFHNWKANSSEIIHSLYINLKRFFNTTTQTATIGQPTWSGGWSGIVLNNDVCIYADNTNSWAVKKINYNGSDFAFVTSADNYATMHFTANEDESTVFFGSTNGPNHILRKINTSNFTVTTLLNYTTSGFFLHSYNYTRIIDNELYALGVDGSNLSLWKYNILTDQLTHVRDDNDFYILTDVNKLNPNWFT